MKKSVFIIVLLICGCVAMPQAYADDAALKRGYRQFWDVSGALTSWRVAEDHHFDQNAGWVYEDIHRQSFGEVILSTIHGYRFNPNFFLGGGLAVGYSGVNDHWFLGAMIDARTDQKFGRYTPFADLRTGVYTHISNGLFINPSIGYRFNFGHRTNLNVSIGVNLQFFGRYDSDATYYTDNTGNILHITLGSDPVFKPFAMLRVGIDF